MTETTAIPRTGVWTTGTLKVRSVKFKNGGEIRVLRRPGTDMRDHIKRRAAEVIAVQSDIVGYAIVVWGANGASAADLQVNDGSRIPGPLVPEFVKMRLLEQFLEHIAEGQCDVPPPEEGA